MAVVMCVAVLLSGCSPQIPSVTAAQVIANPAAWEGKRIWLSGYAVKSNEPEDFETPTILWSSEADAARRDLAPSISVHLICSEQAHQKWKLVYRGPIRLRGIFRSVAYDPLHPLHMEEIDDVEYLEQK